MPPTHHSLICGGSKRRFTAVAVWQARAKTDQIPSGTVEVAAQIGKTALDKRVLRALTKVPRHEFVPVEVPQYAYLNRPLPIGFDKTISQPLMVAVMTDLLQLKSDDVVLEIGSGLGYQPQSSPS